MQRPPVGLGASYPIVSGKFNPAVPKPRAHMNILPLIFNMVLPLVMFVVCCALASSYLMYSRPSLAWTCLALAYMICAAGVANALWQRRHNPMPTWYTYLAILLALAALWGTSVGLEIFRSLSKPHYEALDLKAVENLDVSREIGQSALDLGIVKFAAGSRIDGKRSWHFKHDTVYCVAPIVSNVTIRGVPHCDFWAVGQDCCSTGSSDFRCGDWRSTGTPGAIRAFDEEALGFYRLAVKQAETLYDIVSPNPVFFRWTEDPFAEVASWRTTARRKFLLAVMAFCIFSMLTLALTTLVFSLLGRRSVYGYADADLAAFREFSQYDERTYGI